MKRTRVTTKEGRRIFLYTDDTYTLAFEKMVESKPASLIAYISRRSLIRIINHSTDSAEVYKANKALVLW